MRDCFLLYFVIIKIIKSFSYFSTLIVLVQCHFKYLETSEDSFQGNLNLLLN